MSLNSSSANKILEGIDGLKSEKKPAKTKAAPKPAEKELATAKILISVTPSLKNDIVAAAKENHQSISEFCRQAILKYADL